MSEEKTVTKTQHTLDKKQILILYSYVYGSPAPNAGMSRSFDKLLDQFDNLGVMVHEEGVQTQFLASEHMPNRVQFDFTKNDLNAIKYVIGLRLNPNPQNKYQVSHGFVRSTLMPLAKELGIEEELKKQYFKDEE